MQNSKFIYYLKFYIQGCHTVRKSKKKKDKNQDKMGVFEIKSGNLTKFEKRKILSV